MRVEKFSLMTASGSLSSLENRAHMFTILWSQSSIKCVSFLNKNHLYSTTVDCYYCDDTHEPFCQHFEAYKNILHSWFCFVQTTLPWNFQSLPKKNNVMHPQKSSGPNTSLLLHFKLRNLQKKCERACKTYCIPSIFKNIFKIYFF